MHAVVGRDDAAARGDARFRASFSPSAAPVKDEAIVDERSGYGAQAGPSWSTIAVIAALHAALLLALVQLDVVAIPRLRKPPLVVELIPEPPAPPPAAPAPEDKVEAIRPRVTPMVAPPPLVVVPQPAPPPIATTPEPPAPQAIAVAAQAAPGPPAPVTPPDASAANLGNDAPRYPIESRRRREEGTVRLRVVITVAGRVKEIAVARSSGFERLDRAALDAVRRWKFRPGQQAGVAVEAIGFLSIPFKIAA